MLFKKLAHIMFYISVLIIILWVGCAKDESSPAGPDSSACEYMWVHFHGDSVQVFYKDLNTFDVNTLSKSVASETDAIWLCSFVDTNLIPNYTVKDSTIYDTRSLYAYRIEGDDGFSASVKGYPDNIWDHMKKGYVLIASRRVVFPDDLIDLPGAYNVKDVRHIRIKRKFDIYAPDTSLFAEISEFATTSVLDADGQNEDAVSLSDIVASVISNPETFTYNLQALDGYSLPDDLTWEDLQTGYWLLDSKKTIFTKESLSSKKYQIKYLEKIVVKN